MYKFSNVKRLIACFLICSVIIMQVLLAYSEKVSSSVETSEFSLFINDSQVKGDYLPIIKYETEFFVPIRSLAEYMLLNVLWEAEKEQITISSKENTLIMTVGSNEYMFNEKSGAMSVAPIIYDNITYVPLRVVAESFGFDVTISNEEKLITFDDGTKLYAIPNSFEGPSAKFPIFSPIKVGVKLEDKDGNAIAGQPVEWSSSGQVSFEPESTVTDDNGFSYITVYGTGMGASGYIQATFHGRKCVISFTPGISESPIPAIIYGDLNGDKKINSTDYTMLMRYLLGVPVTIVNEKETCDLNADGKINSTDYALLKRLILSIFTYEDLLVMRR